MPGFDRTGPNGEGPRTGRGMGKCNPGQGETPEERKNFNRPGRGRGFRHRHGGGPGRGR